MRIIAAMAALTVITIVVLASAPPSAECCSTPLYNETKQEVPSGLDWYFIAVFGDNRPENTGSGRFPEAFIKVVREISAMNPYAVVGTGDHVGEGREYQYRALWSNLSSLPNVLLVPGNHDLMISGAEDRWERYVGPRYWAWNGIPGWSIIGVDTYDRLLSRFKEETEKAFEASSGPNRILVTHYPLEPHVGHNIDKAPSGSTKARILWRLIEKYNVSLVLEGHWHGFAYKRVNDTLFVITGGAGAPFYSVESSKTDADYYRTFLHHYVIIILKPDGSYSLLPVYSDKGGVGVVRDGPDRVSLWHTKYYINGSRAVLPFRISLEKDGVNITVQLLAPYGSNVSVWLKSANPVEIVVSGNATNVEAYYTDTGVPIRLSGVGDTFVQEEGQGVTTTGSAEEGETLPLANNTGTGTPRAAQPSGGSLALRWETLLAVGVVLALIIAKRLS